jgi:hypothetical protein
MALTVVVIVRGVSGSDSAERRYCDCKGNGNFLHGVLYEWREVKWRHVTDHSGPGGTDADVFGVSNGELHRLGATIQRTPGYVDDDFVDQASSEATRSVDGCPSPYMLTAAPRIR